MSRPVDIQDSIVIIPNGYTNTGNYNFTLTTTTGTNYIGNAYNNSNNTSYARLQLARSNSSTRKSEIYLELDKSGLSDIPNNATINSVTCYIKYYISNTTYATAFSAQLYANTTAKGNARTDRPTSATRYQITAGTWTRSELNNIRLYLTATHNTSNNNAYVYLYGLDVTVNYSLSGTEYEITSSLATEEIDNISPVGLTYVFEGGNYELTIEGSSIDEIKVEDNGTDVTSSLIQHISPSSSFTFTGIPVSFDSSNSVYNRTAGDSGNGIYSTNYIENGLTDHTSSTRAALYTVQGSGAVSYMYYNFDCSSIPSNATITSVSCQFKGGTQGSSYYSAYTAQLTSGTTLKGSSTSVTGTNASPTTVTINGGSSWTRSELDDIKIKFQVTRGSSNTTTDSTWSFFGATLTVNYTVDPENPYYWTYSLSNIQADHAIVVKDKIIEIPDEDPAYSYYPVTISSINAITTPGRGTIRLVEGSNQTIEIHPTDPSISLIYDNGVDVSNLLVTHGGTIPTPTVSTASGASYGFTYNSSSQYYVSNNKGVDKSAAVCVVHFNLPVRCLVTIEYINYAEATYDFGIFGNVDVPLTNDYKPASGSMPDSNYKLACNTSSANTSSVQTITYEVPSGEHDVYIKYTKDDATSSNNDTLQWKISSIQELEPNNYYTYTLSNIQSEHSLIFIFGDVTYYFVNSSGTGARLFPSGSMVYLPDDNYLLTIVPDDYSYTVSVTDNNADVTSQVERIEEQITKDGSTYTVVNYEYRISNINATHNIIVTCAGSGLPLYIKLNGTYRQVRHIFRKVNSAWSNVELSSLTDSCIYIYKESQ